MRAFQAISWALPANVVGNVSWFEGSRGSIPHGAVKAGQDQDGGTMYVGRAIHNGDVIPAKICPTHGCAFVAYNGHEVSKNDYEVLCSDHIAWFPTHSNLIPQQAIQIGITSKGEPLFAGRTLVEGHMTPGKVHPSHKCLYVPYGGRERSFKEYEVLILF